MTQTQIPGRKYAMTKVARGDYLLPSNDARTLWRLTEYAEDGTAEWQDSDGKWHKVTGVFWQTAKYRDPIPSGGQLPDDFLDWYRWETFDTGLLKRKYAIEAVLGREARA